MHILKSRPLATVLIVLLGGFSLFALLPLLVRVILFTLTAIAAVFVACFARHGERRRYALLLLITAATAAVLSALYFDAWFFADRRFEGETVEIRGHLTEVYHADGYMTIADVRVDTIGNTPVSGYTLRLHDESGELGRVSVSDEIHATVTLSSVLEEGDSLYLIGQGINAKATVIEALEPAAARLDLWRLCTALRAAFAARAESISDADAAGLLSALITGNKQLLSPSLRLSFSRIGITHILALSGMHLSMLSIACISLLSLLGVGKKARTACLIPLVIAYTVFTGAPASLLRASVMLLISSVLFLLRQCRDSITTLTVTVTLICLVSPHAVLDIGLWLSALSTLGLLMMLEDKPKEKARLWRPIRAVLSSFRMTLGALMASLLLSLVSFGGLSLVSPVATFVFGYLVQMYIYLGILAMLLSPILPFLGPWLCTLYRWIFTLSDRMAGGRYTFVDATFPAVRILALLFTALLVLYLLLPVKHKRCAKALLFVLFISVYITATGQTVAARNQTSVFYAQIKTQELFILTSEGQVAAMDLGRGGRAMGEATQTYLAERHVQHLDAYILTRYSTFLPQSVEVILSSVRCEALYVPIPQSEREKDIYERLIRMAKTYRAELIPYGERDPIDVGLLRYEVLRRELDGTALSLWMYIAKEDYILTYFSRGSLSDKTEAAATEIVARSDAVLFGSCGHSAGYVLDIPLSKRVKMCILADSALTVRRDTFESYLRRTKVVLYPKEYTVIR